jgi:hypothetical protein
MRYLGLLLLALTLAAPALAQTERRYDDRGRFTGRAETQGGTTNYYDDRGRKDWRSEKR